MIELDSCGVPRIDVNPNTGEPLNQHRRHMVAVHAVPHDADHPSHIVLPVVP